jgi:crossover junction endodeoxyribonuclease RuvC
LTDRVRILGIDPGSRLTGFGVLDCDKDAARYVASGSVTSVDGEFPARLRQIFDAVTGIVVEFQPHVVAIESVFMHRNASSALKLGHARSAAICATFELDLVVYEYSPREIKQAVVGTGSATKDQIQHMIRHLLRLEREPTADAADALAAALCHANQRRMNRVLDGAALAAGLK